MLIGPGGVGKGTVAKRLVESDPHLWLSRSWTTRRRRDGEPPDAYHFTDRPTFEAHAAAGGFLESAEFLGNLMGTPVPHPPAGSDILLEIEVQGARQVLERYPGATVVLLRPPSEAVQRERMRARGDDEEHIRRRIERGRQELVEGAEIATAEVVNDEVDQAVAEVAAILKGARAARSGQRP